MVVFLTSSPCDDAPEGVDLPFVFKEENEFIANMKKYYKADSNCLLICADPDAYDYNDRMAWEYWQAFAYHGMIYEDMLVLDERNASEAEQLLQNCTMIILAGGHVPTQNTFFTEIGLREKLQQFSGVIMGISAGSMNSADMVYAMPEREGESVDPEYQKFVKGLGLTDINILPHYQMVKDWVLDGKRLYEDIGFEDSMGQCFYVLVDGSYVMVTEKENTLYGEAHLLSDGSMDQICTWGNKVKI